MAAVLVIAFSGSAPASGTDPEADNQGAVHGLARRAAPDNCLSARRAVRFYGRRLTQWRERMGQEPVSWRRGAGVSCPRYFAHLLQRKARAQRRAYERWLERKTLHDFAVTDGNRAWHRAVREAQRPYPGTESWLLSCSASEGGHGRWVANGDGSGAGGWLQFMSGTFWRMFGAARADVLNRGFVLPRSAASWQSPLGQALAGAWGVTHGRGGEWFGGGC